MKKLLLDADVLLYRFAFKNEFSVDFDDGDALQTFADLALAKAEYDDFVRDLQKRLCVTDVVHCLSSSGDTFRYELYPEYKANRNQSTVPTLKDSLKSWVIATKNHMIEPRLEADDLMGLMQTDDTIICTIDKDLDTITGLHFNWNKDTLYEVSQEGADRFFLMQTLMGDTTDNIKGCPQIGKVKAKRFIDEHFSDEDLWEQIVDLYHKQMIRYIDLEITCEEAEEEALMTARLVRILRAGEYDFDTKEIKLWTN